MVPVCRYSVKIMLHVGAVLPLPLLDPLPLEEVPLLDVPLLEWVPASWTAPELPLLDVLLPLLDVLLPPLDVLLPLLDVLLPPLGVPLPLLLDVLLPPLDVFPPPEEDVPASSVAPASSSIDTDDRFPPFGGTTFPSPPYGPPIGSPAPPHPAAATAVDAPRTAAKQLKRMAPLPSFVSWKCHVLVPRACSRQADLLRISLRRINIPRAFAFTPQGVSVREGRGPLSRPRPLRHRGSRRARTGRCRSCR
jgi:hypothetical protein